MVDIPYHTHEFVIPTASEGEIRAGVEAGKAITPDKLAPVLADKAERATTLEGYGIEDAATKEQGEKADTAVQPEEISTVARTGRYFDLENKPILGAAAELNVGNTAGTVAAGDDPRIVGAAQISSLGAMASKDKVSISEIDATGSTAPVALLSRGGLWVDPPEGNFLPTAIAVDDFDSITANGIFRGYNAVGTPAYETQIVLDHYESTGGRAWQVARSQLTEAGVLPRTWERYRKTDGVWISWAESAKIEDTATTIQGKKADSAVQPSAGHPLYLFLDGTGGVVYDFTDRLQLGVANINDAVSSISDSLGNSRLYVPAVNTSPSLSLERGRFVLKSVNETDLLASPADEPLLPVSGDFVLAWSHKTLSTGAKACIWQQQGGAVGRTQITANARYTGSGVSNVDHRLQVFMAGVSEGGGASGMIADAAHPIGQWDDFVLVLREGSKQSTFYRNGVIVDTFTRPASIPQVQTTIFRNAAQVGAGQAIGRILCLRRAPKDGEVDLIRAWIRESFTSFLDNNDDGGEPWVEPAITSIAGVVRSKRLPGFDAGKIWGTSEGLVLRPGSMTKLMTAYVGLNWLKKLDALDTLFTRTAEDSASGSGANLEVGDTIDVVNALANMGLPSSNITANIWARTIGFLILSSEGGSGDGTARFILAMNAANLEIGLTQSTWMNPSGLDAAGHLSSATDISLLCEKTSDHHPEIIELWSNPTWQLQITGSNARTITIAHSVRFITNGDQRVVWGKTGTTPLAQNCLLCEVKAPKGNRYFYVGFGATTDNNRYSDADAVFNSVEAGVVWPNLIPSLRQHN